jgi:hypothetical protein
VKRRIFVRPEAEAEIDSAATWYEGKRRGLGKQLIVAAEKAIAAIKEAPEAYPRWKAGYPFRKSTLTRFPFAIFFTVDEFWIRIIAFAHTKRRPGYWVSRPRC